jgi:hypothetical protein
VSLRCFLFLSPPLPVIFKPPMPEYAGVFLMLKAIKSPGIKKVVDPQT